MSDIMTCALWAGGALGGVIVIALVAKLREVWAAARWPSALGKVVVSEVQARHRGDDAGGVGNYPRVEYEYEVAGKTYTGSRIGIGEEAPDTDVAETLGRYPVGSGVLVFYNPKDPAKSVLERHLPPGIGKGVAILLLFLVGGPILLGLIFSSLPDRIAPHLPHPDRAPFVVALAGFACFAALIARAAGNPARKARAWPAVQGLILTSEMETYQTRLHRRMQTMYRPKVVYAYDVNGRRYAGSKVSFGGVTGASNPKWVEAPSAKYPKGAMVQVYYNPRNPAEAVLEHHTGPTYILWIIAAALLAASYLVATWGAK